MSTQQEQQTQQALKYADLLAQSKDQKDAQARGFQVEEAHQELSASILATKKKVAEAGRILATKKSQFPLDVKGILDAQISLADYNAGLEALEALETELF